MKTDTNKIKRPTPDIKETDILITCPNDNEVQYFLRSCVDIFRQPTSLRKWCQVCRAPEQAMEKEKVKS